MEYKSLGVIGGMGPKATSVFFEKVIESTVTDKDQDHIDMVILNHATLPDRTSAILNHREEVFLESIKKDFKLLELAGVANIAIPCNTAHYFYEKMLEMTEINIINMVEETIREIYMKCGENSKVGIVATTGTISTGIYEYGCDKYNMQLCTPNESVQEQIMNVIYNNIKCHLDVDALEIETIINDLVFKENCDCVIIACTELSCIQLSDEVAKYCIDAMSVLIKKSIELSGRQTKSPQRTAKSIHY
jgi:aspartate racemase